MHGFDLMHHQMHKRNDASHAPPFQQPLVEQPLEPLMQTQARSASAHQNSCAAYKSALVPSSLRGNVSTCSSSQVPSPCLRKPWICPTPCRDSSRCGGSGGRGSGSIWFLLPSKNLHCRVDSDDPAACANIRQFRIGPQPSGSASGLCRGLWPRKKPPL
jgi:hypothetical protein